MTVLKSKLIVACEFFRKSCVLLYVWLIARFVRPFNDDTVPYGGDHGGEVFGFPGFPFNHDDIFRQMDEAFNRMMKNFGSFDGHVPDQEPGSNVSFSSATFDRGSSFFCLLANSISYW